MDWFDAIKVGLTATPAAHTIAYFENLVYRYDYEGAVSESYFVDYDVVRVRSDVRMNGVFLLEGEQIDQVDPDRAPASSICSRARGLLMPPRWSALSPHPTAIAKWWLS
jgi:type I site-specific restriction endonuclease